MPEPPIGGRYDMANAEGQNITVRTEGLSQNGLLGDFRQTKSSEPITRADVERIIEQVRQSFEKFTQQQLTYAQKTSADASSSSSSDSSGTGDSGTPSGSSASSAATSTETPTSGGGNSGQSDTKDGKGESGNGGGGASGKNDDGIAGKFNKAVSWMKEKVTGIIPKDMKGKLKKGMGTFTSLFSSKALIIGTLTVVVLAALKSAISNPIMLLVLVMVGTYLYKMFLASHVKKFLDLFNKFKASWDKMGDFDIFEFILTLRKIYENVIKPLASFIDTAKAKIAEIKAAISDFWGNLKAQWAALWDGGIVGTLKETWKTMKDSVALLWDGVVKATKGAGKWIGDFFKEKWDDIVMGMKKSLAKLPVVGKMFGSEASINAERIAGLNDEGKKLEEERKKLMEALGKAKTDDERKEIRGKLDDNKAEKGRFVEKAKRFRLSDKELEEARTELAKNGQSMYGGAYFEAVNDRGSFDVRSAARKDSSYDLGGGGGGQLKAAVGEGGVKTYTMTPAQGDEMENRIRKVFGKNLDRMKASAEKRGEEFDEKAAIKSLEEKLLAGLDRLADRTEDLSKKQLSDEDLRKAMSLATRTNGKPIAQTSVVVQNPEPTPPRSTPGR